MHVTALFLKVLLVKNKQHEVVCCVEYRLGFSGCLEQIPYLSSPFKTSKLIQSFPLPLRDLGRLLLLQKWRRDGDLGKGKHLDF